MTHPDCKSLLGILRVVLRSMVLASAVITGVSAAQNPVPLINQPLVPDAVKPGGTGFTLAVNGTGFVSGATVNWNGRALATTFVSNSRLRASVPAGDVIQPVTAAVTVVNGAGGGVSNPGYLAVTAPSSSAIGLARADYGTANATYGISSGDFNGDGKLDLAVADYDTGTVGVLLGNGDGTFQTQVEYATGSSPYAVAVGDFNGDGNLDLAVANGCTDCPFGGSVSILLGNGDGTFQTHVDYATGNNPGAIVLADLNGDGKLDVAVVNTSDGTVGVFLGNGDGTLQTQLTYTIASTACCQGEVGVGDFNRDGKLDLVAAAGNGVSVLLGNGDGTFQMHVDYSGGGAAVGDFNGDGKLDLTDGSSVLLGNGDGTFQSSISTGTGGGNVALADFNGDGRLDIAVANNYDGATIAVLLGNGDGTFQPAVNYSTASYPTSVVAGDFNGDGRIDVSAAALNVVSVLAQIPTVSLSPSTLSFAEQLLGTTSATQIVTLRNTSGLTLKMTSLAVTGTNAADFSETNTCGSGLTAGGKCTINVNFTPAQVGPRTASITVTDNASGSPQQVALVGTGVVSGPNLTFSPSALAFATQLTGTTSSAQPILLSNYGTSTLDIKGFAVKGTNASDFAQTNGCGNSVAPGANCTVNVTFTPSQIGTRTATLLVSDNAPGSPQRAALTGAGTAVQLNPASLDFGSIAKTSSETLPTTLTNTASTVLAISSIATAGAQFSQTNTCGSSVAAGASCTISVTFTPGGIGTFTGTLSISDNGGGSPQQVPLSGTGTRIGFSEAVRSALSLRNSASVPSPTGRSWVGTRGIDFVDSRRVDPFLADGTKRQILLRFWYPVFPNVRCVPAKYASAKVWSYFSRLVAVPLPEVATNSCQDAPVLEGAHPVIVFTHGFTGTFTDYTFLFEDLASRGYIVAALNHTYEATAEEFPDGRFITSRLGSHLAGSTVRGDARTLAMAVSVRLDDIKSVLDELARLNVENDSPFAAKLDMNHIAIAGHSLGGVTALLSVEKDARIRAGVSIDGWPESLSTMTKTPVLLVAAGHQQWSDAEQRLWDQLAGPRFAVNLRGAEHVTPTDAIWLANGAIKSGTMGSEKTIAAIRDYIAAFLEQNLLGGQANHLLTGQAAEYPDAELTTQEQALRSKQ